MALLMSSIIISGVIFMHKEITSTGEIITHIHPYNFGEKNKHQHESDAQIRLLDVLYHGTYLEPSFTNYTFLAPTFFAVNYTSKKFDNVIKAAIYYLFLRGPPALA